MSGWDWRRVRDNPQQAAMNLDSLQLACRNIKNLLEDGSPSALAEVKEWAKNASKLGD